MTHERPVRLPYGIPKPKEIDKGKEAEGAEKAAKIKGPLRSGLVARVGILLVAM